MSAFIIPPGLQVVLKYAKRIRGSSQERPAGSVAEAIALAAGEQDSDLGEIAVARGAVLVTGNARRFERMPGVLLEDWIRG